MTSNQVKCINPIGHWQEDDERNQWHTSGWASFKAHYKRWSNEKNINQTIIAAFLTSIQAKFTRLLQDKGFLMYNLECGWYHAPEYYFWFPDAEFTEHFLSFCLLVTKHPTVAHIASVPVFLPWG
jgi:hypothetical protein